MRTSTGGNRPPALAIKREKPLFPTPRKQKKARQKANAHEKKRTVLGIKNLGLHKQTEIF